jgi:signal transduction histidine kinase
MTIPPFLQLIVFAWGLAIGLLALHYASPRIGAGAFIVTLAGIVAFIQIQIDVYIVPFEGIILYLTSHIILPSILMSILVLYVVNGSQVARLTMFGLVGVSALIAVFMLVAQSVLQPGSVQVGGAAFALVSNFTLRDTIASILTFLADMVAIAIVYQGSKNVFGPRVPEAIPIGMALLAALWTDAVVFVLLAQLGNDAFAADLPGSILGKTVAALVLWPVAAVYLTHFAPRLPDYQGAEKRPIFELFSPSLKQVRLELVQAKADLATRDREVGEERAKVQSLRNIISEASHDLRTPLTAINMKIYRLGRTTDPTQQKAELEALNDLTGRMNAMIEDMLTLSRLDSGTDFETLPTPINPVVLRACEPVLTLATNKQLTFDLQLKASDQPVLADADDLERAVTNLVANAVRYTPAGGQIIVETVDEANGVRLRVRDTGIGIPPAEQARIFERFYRSKAAQQVDPSGTGLGLAIVKRVVDLHRGQISVQSEVGKGSTFDVLLPRALG